MKKFAIALAAFSIAVHASDWKPAGSSGNLSSHVDMASIVKVGAFRKAWFMWDYSEQQYYSALAYKSSKNILHFDCAKNLVGAGPMTLYAGVSGGGSVVKSFDSHFDPNEMEDVPPDTIGEFNLRLVCSKNLKRH